MNPSAEWSLLFTPVVTPAKTPHPRVQQECHRYASCNEPSSSLSTLYPSATTDMPAESGDLTTLIYSWMCPSTIHLLHSRLFMRVRKRRFSSSPRAQQFANQLSSFHSRVCAPLRSVTFLGGASGLLRVPFQLVGDIFAY